MDRVVIFAGGGSGGGGHLVRGALQALAGGAGAQLAAICMPDSPLFAGALVRHAVVRLIRQVAGAFDPARPAGRLPPVPVNVRRWARRMGAEVLVPPGGDINHPAFVARLRREIEPTFALSLYCLQKFGPDLLSVFRHAVNFHNGLLPGYRGLRTTAWSVYCGERETGFTFHRMSDRLDEGPVLVQRALPVGPDSDVPSLDLDKAVAAAGLMPDVLRMTMNGDPGRPQGGGGRYFSRRDHWAITTIGDPSALSSGELTLRMRAFGRLRMRMERTWHWVTKISRVPDAPAGNDRFVFRAADGVVLHCARLHYLPAVLYKPLAGWLGASERPPDFTDLSARRSVPRAG